MATRRTKPKAAKKTPPRRNQAPGRGEITPSSPQAVLPPPAALPLDGDPSPEELRELEASVEREQQREKVLGLAREYPRTDRALVDPLTAVLKNVPGLKPVHARVAAQSLKQLADLGHDLDEIVERILHQKHDPGEVAELVMAFQIITEQIGSYSDVLGDKLYDLFDRAKGLK
jgi:hypothetical protein